MTFDAYNSYNNNAKYLFVCDVNINLTLFNKKAVSNERAGLLSINKIS
jgi:hypothetical protein